MNSGFVQQADPRRQPLLGKIHIAKKQLGLDDDTYRAIVARHGKGKTSAAELSVGQLIAMIEEMKGKGFRVPKPRRAGARPIAPGAQAAKIRALWLALYHLGEAADPAEAAIDAFARRMTKRATAHGQGVDSLRWLEEAAADRVIKALRSWCERVDFTFPDSVQRAAVAQDRKLAGLPPAPALPDKLALLHAQWLRLQAAGGPRFPGGTLQGWLLQQCRVFRPTSISEAAADAAVEILGRWLRKEKSDA